MPIKGLTDRPAPSLTRALPKLATIHKGGPKRPHPTKPGKMIAGEDLPYFRIQFEPEYEHLLPFWTKLYGEQPTEIRRVFLTAPGMDEAFISWYEEWGASGLVRRCDGGVIVRRFEDGRYVDTPAPCTAPTCGCKKVGRLALFLPDFFYASKTIGWFSLATHSVYDIMAIHGYLSWVTDGGKRPLAGVEFVVGRTEQEVRYVDDKSKERRKVKKWLIILNVSENYMGAVLLPRIVAGEMVDPPPIMIGPGAEANGDEDDEGEDAGSDEIPTTVPPVTPPPPKSGNGSGKAQSATAPSSAPPAKLTDWRNPPGSNHIAKLVKLTGKKPPDLFTILEKLGMAVNAEMTPEAIRDTITAYEAGADLGGVIGGVVETPDEDQPSEAPPDGVEDGEIVEEPPATLPTAPLPPIAGLIPSWDEMRRREAPFSAGMIKAFVSEQVSQLGGKSAGSRKFGPSDKQKFELVRLLGECAGSNKDDAQRELERHLVTCWLTGKRGVSALNLAEWQAVVAWLEGGEGGQPHAQAHLEYQFVLEAADAAVAAGEMDEGGEGAQPEIQSEAA